MLLTVLCRGITVSVSKRTVHHVPGFPQPAPGIPGMPVTMPISLPGMPPITVSTTLPYTTLGLQVTVENSESQPVVSQ
jgi:hypothetical protein